MQDDQGSGHELYEYWVADFNCRAYTDNLPRSTLSSNFSGLDTVVAFLSQNDVFENLEIKLYRRFQFMGVDPDLRVASGAGAGTQYATKDDFFAALKDLRDKVADRVKNEDFDGLRRLHESLNADPKIVDCHIPDLSPVTAYQKGSPLWVVYEGSTEGPDKFDKVSLKLVSTGGYETESKADHNIVCHLGRTGTHRVLPVYPRAAGETADGHIFIADEASGNFEISAFASEESARAYYENMLQTALDISRARKNEPQRPAPDSVRLEI